MQAFYLIKFEKEISKKKYDFVLCYNYILYFPLQSFDFVLLLQRTKHLKIKCSYNKPSGILAVRAFLKKKNT